MAATVWPVGLRLVFDTLCGLAPADAAARTLYLGLASDFPVDSVPVLENITEITTAGYTREAVSWADVLAGYTTVATYASLPVLTEADANEGFYVTDEDAAYVWTGTAFVGATNPRYSSPVQNWNSTDITIGPLTEDMTVPAAYAFLCTAASGTDGALLISWDLVEPVQSSQDQPLLVPATQLIVE